jgi:hypothetical protein
MLYVLLGCMLLLVAMMLLLGKEERGWVGGEGSSSFAHTRHGMACQMLGFKPKKGVGCLLRVHRGPSFAPWGWPLSTGDPQKMTHTHTNSSLHGVIIRHRAARFTGTRKTQQLSLKNHVCVRTFCNISICRMRRLFACLRNRWMCGTHEWVSSSWTHPRVDNTRATCLHKSCWPFPSTQWETGTHFSFNNSSPDPSKSSRVAGLDICASASIRWIIDWRRWIRTWWVNIYHTFGEHAKHITTSDRILLLEPVGVWVLLLSHWLAKWDKIGNKQNKKEWWDYFQTCSTRTRGAAKKSLWESCRRQRAATGGRREEGVPKTYRAAHSHFLETSIEKSWTMIVRSTLIGVAKPRWKKRVRMLHIKMEHRREPVTP